MLDAETKEKAKEMFEKPGTTIRQVSNTLGIAWDSAKRIAQQVNRTLCGCGRRVNHQGLCSYRSEGTTYSKTKEVISPLVVKLEEIKITPSTGKCVELGCVYPAYGNGRCRTHLADYYSAFSLTMSTMNTTYFFPERHYTRRVL